MRILYDLCHTGFWSDGLRAQKKVECPYSTNKVEIIIVPSMHICWLGPLLSFLHNYVHPTNLIKPSILLITVTSMGHKVKKQNFKITPIKLEMYFYETYDIPLDNLRSYGFRCPLKGASGGVKRVSGGNFYILIRYSKCI